MNQRFEYIDALRGIAILGVIIAHAGSISQQQGTLGQLTLLGAYGVQLFFVVSGFTIFLSLDRNKKDESSLVRNFFIRRFFRIIPIYWFGIFLYTAVYGLGSRGWLPGPEIWHFPVHALLGNLLHPETQSSVVPGGWSISCEVIFYLFVPLLFSLVKTTKSAISFLLLVVLAGPWLTQTLSILFLPMFSGVSQDMLNLYWYRSMPNQIGCFAAGMAFFFVQKNHFYHLQKLKNAFVSLAFCFLVISLLHYAYAQFSSSHSHLIYSVGFACLAAVLSQTPWRLFVCGFTIFMGKISYSAYLLHFLVLKQLVSLLAGFDLDPSLNFSLILLLGIIITIFFSYLSYKYIEIPFIDFGRTLIVKSRNKNADTRKYARI